MSVTIRSNAGVSQDVLIRDLGFTVPSGGGSVVVSDLDEIRQLGGSDDLLVLCTDNAFGIGSSTLILNDGASDVPQGYAEIFLAGASVLATTTPGDYAIPMAPLSGRLVEGFMTYKTNFAATTAPTVNDDQTQGYSTGSRWLNTVTGKLYECYSAATGAAVWVTVASGTSGALQNNWDATTNPTANSDNTQGYSQGSFWFNTATGTLMTCTSAATGAATWVTVAYPTSNLNIRIAEAADTVATNSQTYVIVPGMTITPGVGTYELWFSGSVETEASNVGYISIFNGGSQIATSERRAITGGNNPTGFTCMAIASVADGQAIEGRYKSSANKNVTIYARTLLARRIS